MYVQPFTHVDSACDTTPDALGPGKRRGVVHAAEHRAHCGSSPSLPVLVNHGLADGMQVCLLYTPTLSAVLVRIKHSHAGAGGAGAQLQKMVVLSGCHEAMCQHRCGPGRTCRWQVGLASC